MTKAFQFFSRQFIQSHVNATVKMLFKHHFTSYVQYVYLSYHLESFTRLPQSGLKLPDKQRREGVKGNIHCFKALKTHIYKRS